MRNRESGSRYCMIAELRKCAPAALMLTAALFPTGIVSADDQEPLFPDPIDVRIPAIGEYPNIEIDYDIVYVRAQRAGDEEHRRFYTDFSQPVTFEPGADLMRRIETPLVSEILGRFRTVHSIAAPGTLDGGDVVRLGKKVFVGLSSRTNQAGVDQLETHLVPYGYTVNRVELAGCLHLKTAATPVLDDALLINQSWVAPAAFGGMRTIKVHPTEPFGANALLVQGTVIHSAAHPRTRERLEKNGIFVRSVEFSELEKAEAGVTSCCVLFNVG